MVGRSIGCVIVGSKTKGCAGVVNRKDVGKIERV